MRLTILVIPPVLPLIHRDLNLSVTGVAALTGLPVLFLGLAAIPGSLIIARLGVRNALLIGMTVCGLASAGRGLVGTETALFLMTAAMSFGISIMQPAMPSVVRAWAPRKVGFATAIYANGLLVGETLAAALTIPLVLPLAGGSWRSSLVLWALPVLASAVAFGLYRPAESGEAGEASAALSSSEAAKMGWMPNWRSARTWQMGFLMGGCSTVYFGANAFIPDYMTATGRPGLIGPCLAALNAGQLPASFLLLIVASRWTGRRLPFIAMAAVTSIGIAGLLLLQTPGAAVVCAGVIGFSAAGILILALALPAILSEPDEVHRLSAGAFSIGYTTAFLLPLLGGALWDHTHQPGAAFVPLGAGVALVLSMAGTLRMRHLAAAAVARGAV